MGKTLCPSATSKIGGIYTKNTEDLNIVQAFC